MGNSVVVREIRERDEWNALVLGLPNCDLRQGYEWGEAHASQGWIPRRIAVFEGEVCMAAISILAKRIPVLGRSILHAPGGPLIIDTMHEPAWEGLLEGIRRTVSETRAIFLRVSPRVPNEEVAIRRALAVRGFQHLAEDWTTWNSPRITMTMNLQEPEESLRQKLRRRYREYISSASRRGLSVRTAVSFEEACDFRDSLVLVGRRKRFPVRRQKYFEQLWEEYVTKGRGVLLLAVHHGKAVGGLLGAGLGEKAYMLYVTAQGHVDGERLYQGPLLYWEFVRWAKKNGCKEIDWGGVGTNFPPREDDPGFGVYHFKLGFNSTLQYLTGYYDIVFSKPFYKVFRFLERRVSATAWNFRAKLNGRFSTASPPFSRIETRSPVASDALERKNS